VAFVFSKNLPPSDVLADDHSADASITRETVSYLFQINTHAVGY
jgi:hypothetical protein